jgi:hypothetical protein
VNRPKWQSAKMAVPPLNKFPCSNTAPPLPETTAHVLTSLPSPSYKSHCSPRLWAAPSFPWPAWQFGPAIKLCSMDVRLFSWAFFVSGIFPNINHWKISTPLRLSLLSLPSALPNSLANYFISLCKTLKVDVRKKVNGGPFSKQDIWL